MSKRPCAGGPAVPVRHKPHVEGELVVCGFRFLFAGYFPNARTPAFDAASWACPEIKASLFRYSDDSWGVRMHRAEATGSTSDEAFRAAYVKLDALSDDMTRVLNMVFERDSSAAPTHPTPTQANESTP